MSESRALDVVVLGSGFGGSLLAAALGAGGMSVAVVDRARHPRFAIGESSTPAADLLLQQIATRHGLDEVLPLTKFGTWRDAYPQVNCGCKRGFSYFHHAGPLGFRATDAHENELLVAASSSRAAADTQWYRADVDAFLVEVARNRGVEVIEGAQVVDVEHRAPNDWVVVVEHEGSVLRLESAFVVDASGPAGVLMNRVGVPDAGDELATRSAAVYSHWRGVRPVGEWLREQGSSTGDYPYPVEDSVIHHLFEDGWLWQIPFEDGTTSLGYVFADPAAAIRESTAEATWKRVVRDRPALADVLGPTLLAEFPGELFRTRGLQRMRAEAAGEDWAALPYTVGFIDPLHSTGIAHTLSGVARLVGILLERCGDERVEALRAYTRDVGAELRLVDRLVSGCYAALGDFRLFTTWVMAYFAAATTYERRRIADPAGEVGFLCADDSRFVRMVERMHGELASVRGGGNVEAFVSRMREELAPYNHVGLFEPAAPNMYWHTALEK